MIRWMHKMVERHCCFLHVCVHEEALSEARVVRFFLIIWEFDVLFSDFRCEYSMIVLEFWSHNLSRLWSNVLLIIVT